MIKKVILVVLAMVLSIASSAFAQQAEKATAPKSPMQTFTDTVTGMQFVFVKGGCYDMGDTFGDGTSAEKPVHMVCVNDFYIGKFEVTQGQWMSIQGNNPSHFIRCGDKCPVEKVSWSDTRQFIRKLNERSGRTYRLPTEAEWEYAARSGGKKEKYAGTSNESELGNYAWYDKNSSSKTHPVGQLKPNGLGIYDMSGNVCEWVDDLHDDNYYKNSANTNPQGPTKGSDHVFRGGFCLNPAGDMRATIRQHYDPFYRVMSNGFRLAITPVRDMYVAQ